MKCGFHAWARGGPRGGGIAAALLCTVPPAGAGAQTEPPAPSFSVEWAAPAGCPTGDAVRERVTRLLGGAAESLVRRPLTAHAVVTRTEAGAALRLQTTDNGIVGERTIEGTSCEDVSSAGALVIALAVDPEAVAAHASPSSTASFDPPATAPAAPIVPATAVPVAPLIPMTPAAAARPAPAPAATPGAEGTIELRALLDIGTLPKVAPGVGAASGFGANRWRARLEATWLPSRFGAASTSTAALPKGADVSLFAATGVGCYAVAPGDVEVSPCALVEAGTLWARGTGFRQASSDAIRLWMAAGGAVELSATAWTLLRVRLGVGGLVPLTPPTIRFLVTDGKYEELHRPAAVVGRLTLGVGFGFR